MRLQRIVRGDNEKGITLIEMLVVLVIISILASVAMRAMDITRERSNFDKTMKSMERLAMAVTGNQNLVAEGHRTDFGFVGDIGRLPQSLDELRDNLNHNVAWNGPYARLPFEGDSFSFKTDAWGREYSYLPEQAVITSLGNGRSPITYRITEDTYFLFRNRVRGTISDNAGNVPGEMAAAMRVSIWVVDPQTGNRIRYDTIPGSDGHYVFDEKRFRIPMGVHQMMLRRSVGAGDSMTKWVIVHPRVGAIVDFRLGEGSLMLGGLRYVPYAVNDFATPGVYFNVMNIGQDTIVVDSIQFYGSDPTVWLNRLRLNGKVKWQQHTPERRAGNNEYMGFVTQPETVFPTNLMRVSLDSFFTDENPGGNDSLIVDMRGKRLGLRFDDGSLVGFTVP